MVNVVVLGCRSNTKFFIEFLLKQKIFIKLIISIDKKSARLNVVPDYTDFKDLEERVNIYKHHRYDLIDFPQKVLLEIMECDICFCIGWQRLIPEEILSKFKFGVFGMHATEKKLPYGKGRSPVNWALINGSRKLHANVIKYDESVDGGLIYSSNIVDVNMKDNIHTLQQRLSFIFALEAIKILEDIKMGGIKLEKQNKEISEYFYPRRSEKDGLINLTWTVNQICDFVRAQTRPYPGAFFLTNVGEIKIWNCQEFLIPDTTLIQKYANGEIVGKFSDNSFLINFVDGLLLVTEHEFPLEVEHSKIILKGDKDV